MLPVANILLLVINAIFLVSLFTAPAPKQQVTTSSDERMIEYLAEIKSDIAAIPRQPMMQSKVEYGDDDEKDEKDDISVVCIAYQISLRSGSHFWTYIDTVTGKPLFCSPNSPKTKIPTIDVDDNPQDYREDLLEP